MSNKAMAMRNATWFVAGAFAGALLLSNGIANAITDSVFKYSAAKTGYFSIPSSAFMPTNSVVTWGNAYALTTSDNSCFYAPVHLPSSAKMTGLSISYFRNATASYSVQLSRQSLSAVKIDQLVNQTLADTGGAYSVANYPIVTSQTVDNLRFAYVVVACMSAGNNALYAARVTYTYANAGD
jgi:hypothetical protein